MAMFMVIHLLPAAGLILRRRAPGGRRRPPQRHRLSLRLEQPLHVLERPHRRHLPLALLLRLRSIAGAALPHRQSHSRRASSACCSTAWRKCRCSSSSSSSAPWSSCSISLSPRPLLFQKPALEKARTLQRLRRRGTELRDARSKPARKPPSRSPRSPRQPGSHHPLPRRSGRFQYRPRNKAPSWPKRLSGTKYNDTNYVFLSFVTQYLPAGLVGLIIAVIFAAAMSSSAGEINSLATVTVMDLYRRYLKPVGSGRPLPDGLPHRHRLLGRLRHDLRAIRQEPGLAGGSREPGRIALLRLAARRLHAGVLLQATSAAMARSGA